MIYDIKDFVRVDVDVPMGTTGPNVMMVRKKPGLGRLSTQTVRVFKKRPRRLRIATDRVLVLP